MKYFIKDKWKKFWYKWNYPENISFGRMNGYKTFRKQRLFNIIIILLIITLLFLHI